MLEIENLSFAQGRHLLLNDISLKLHPGEIYALLGPNGAGKSTLLKAIAGLWKPTTGKVLWKGDSLHALDRKEISKILTFVPQNPQVVFDYSVEEFVAMGRYAHQTSGSISQFLQQVNIYDLRHRPVNQVSQGERQRVYIARALATEAPILLLDEPTASLDIRQNRDIWQLLLQLAEQGKTLLIANHDLVSTEQYCRFVAVLKDGRCISKGPYAECITPSLLHRVFGI